MIERNDAADHAQGLADGEVDDVRTHRDRCALHLGHEAGKELHLGGGDHRIADHLLDGIAAVGGVDHRELVGILAQDFAASPQDFCTLERQHMPPFGECGLCHGHRRIDVLGAGVGDLTERLSRAGVDRVGVAARHRLVPGAAIIGAAIFRQYDRLRRSGLRGNGGCHDGTFRLRLTCVARSGSAPRSAPW